MSKKATRRPSRRTRQEANLTSRKKTRKGTLPSQTDADRDGLTSVMNFSLALREAYRLLPTSSAWGKTESDAIARVVLEVGTKFLGRANSDRWLAALRGTIKDAPAIPQEAKAALQTFVSQIEHEFFGPYIYAAILTGTALGLKGYGANLVGTKGAAR